MSARESGRAEQPTEAVSAENPIGPVSPEQLAKAAGLGQMADESARLRDLEWRAYLSKRRSADRREVPERTPEDLTGIALSGGGIRSAIFALGVLQALARRGLLGRFDYLSTVSGGGYIGASLTWLTSQAVLERAGEVAAKNDGPSLPKKGFGLGPSSSDTPFPYGTDDPRTATEPERSRAEGAMLRYLRQHGNYLTPGSGLTFTSIIVVVLRGLILNLLVWVPIIATVMAILVAFSPPASPLAPYAAFRVMLMAAAGLLGACVVAFAVYLVTTYGAHTAESASYRWSRRWAGQRYSSRRHFESWMRWPLWIAIALLLLGSPPFVVGKLHGWVAGPTFSLIGVLSGLATFARTMQPRPKRAERSGWSIPSGWIASIGAACLLYGVLLLSFAIGRSAGLGWNEGAYGPVVALGAGLAVAVVTGIVVDLSLITVHRFYRDRLMEAFLPDMDKALANETAPAGQADAAALKAMCPPDHPVGPYHIINTNLVLIESDDRTYRLRGGDSFMLSPLLCGSNATGWQPTDRFMDGELTLLTAMAISRAAANTWTASGGVGVTRSLLVATLMALLNLRLGFWAPNPRDPSCTESYRPNHFHPGLLEVMGLSLKGNLEGLPAERRRAFREPGHLRADPPPGAIHPAVRRHRRSRLRLRRPVDCAGAHLDGFRDADRVRRRHARAVPTVGKGGLRGGRLGVAKRLRRRQDHVSGQERRSSRLPDDGADQGAPSPAHGLQGTELGLSRPVDRRSVLQRDPVRGIPGARLRDRRKRHADNREAADPRGDCGWPEARGGVSRLSITQVRCSRRGRDANARRD